jgi:hypothetical protein
MTSDDIAAISDTQIEGRPRCGTPIAPTRTPRGGVPLAADNFHGGMSFTLRVVCFAGKQGHCLGRFIVEMASRRYQLEFCRSPRVRERGWR